MSLQQAAKYLQSKGRGEDSVLVHMTPGEVKSLQAVAMAHGGTLGVNPETGLPEAGFLSNIMPMIVGAGLAAATGGTSLALTPGMIGLGVGGLETLRTGNLNKGIMAGLGAYGGAGLGAGLMGAGAPEAIQAANPQLTGGEIAREMGQAGFVQPSGVDKLTSGVSALGDSAGRSAFMGNVGGGAGLAKFGLSAAAPMLMGDQQGLTPLPNRGGPNPYNYQYSANPVTPTPMPDVPTGDLSGRFGREQRYFNPVYTPIQPVTQMAGGGPVEMMSNANAVGANTGYPMADISRGAYATPYQQPISQNVLSGGQDTRVDPYTGEERLAKGGLSHLGDYSDGGRLLRGPGDGVSDSIPAVIGDKQPARLADGEFVVPARIVSELGNGSTEAGARKLYAMMDRVQKARGKTVGKGKVAANSRADKHLPA
jgi:hypothetical protein